MKTIKRYHVLPSSCMQVFDTVSSQIHLSRQSRTHLCHLCYHSVRSRTIRQHMNSEHILAYLSYAFLDAPASLTFPDSMTVLLNPTIHGSPFNYQRSHHIGKFNFETMWRKTHLMIEIFKCYQI